LAVAETLGVRVHEEALTLGEFESANEVFLSASNLELLPVTRLDQRVIGAGKPGPVSLRLHEAYRERVRQACGIAELVPL
jgi:branched-subunit amino acid aminotransferase/4-amino-4-deoxychorismate lyase